MEAVIYLEPDEEITSVIEKLKRSKSPIVGIVAPRNAVLLQSVVNLKLLKRQAKTLKKDIALVTGDRIGQNLALRTGLTVYANVHDTEPLEPLKDLRPETIVEDDVKTIPTVPTGGFKVHRYDETSDIVDAQDSDESTLDDQEAVAANFSSRALNTNPNDLDESDDAQDDQDIQDKIEEKSSKEDKSESGKSSTHKEGPIDKKSEKEPPKIQDFHPSSALRTKRTTVNFTKIIPIILVFLIIVGGIGYLGLTSVSKATVNIVVASEPINQDISFTVSKDRSTIDAVKNLIPGRLIESTQQSSKNYKATGTKDIGEKATGSVTVSNSDGGKSLSFVAGTTLKVVGSSLTFSADKSFTVPSATAAWNGHSFDIIPGTIKINVTANAPGEDSNIDPTSYTISGYSAISGKGSTMAGGSTKQVTIVSQGDLDKATTDATTDLFTKSSTELKQKAGDAIFLDKAIKNEITDTSSDTEVGTQVADFTLTIKVKSSILVFDSNNIKELITQTFESKIPKNKTLLATDTKNLKYEVASNDPQAGTMQITTGASAKIIPKLNKSEIKTALAGKTSAQVRTYFSSIGDINNVDISLNPTWWLKKIPKDTKKITVDIKTQDKLP